MQYNESIEFTDSKEMAAKDFEIFEEYKEIDIKIEQLEPCDLVNQIGTENEGKNSIAIDTGDFFEEWNEIHPQIHIRKFEEQTA